MIKDIFFNEIVPSALTKEITATDYDSDGFYERKYRLGFSINDNRSDLPNFKIKNMANFNNLLEKYVYLSLKTHDLEFNRINIKKVLILMWSNITTDEFDDLESYVEKYIKFLINNQLLDSKVTVDTNIGLLVGNSIVQSLNQETPYAFRSYFEKQNADENIKYYLPRISYGISNDICYIYAIQNKDNKENDDSQYISQIKEQFQTINKGINKYRNVTPSFVVALTYFISYLEVNNINKIVVVSELPIRKQNRELVNNYKIKVKTMSGNLLPNEVEKFKEDLEKQKEMIDYNSTTKFHNSFNRLKLHFDNLFNNDITQNEVIELLSLKTNNEFLRQIVAEKTNYMVK